jgi:hypothetical protein
VRHRSVKAYNPGNLVTANVIRVSCILDADPAQGFHSTTHFAPGLPRIGHHSFHSARLELVNGEKLLSRFTILQ